MSRLTVEDKKRFIKELTKNLSRMQEIVPYPFAYMSDEDMQEFVQQGVDEEVLKAVDTLKQWGKSNVSHLLTHRANVAAIDITGEIVGSVRVDLPKATIVTRRDILERLEPGLYNELANYILYRKYAERLADMAYNWVERAVNSCTSVGQLKRALPDFAPLYSDWMRHQLAHAQRASRMPQGFPHDMYSQTLALNAITAASLLPAMTDRMPIVDLNHHGSLMLKRMWENKVTVFSWQPQETFSLPDL